MEHEELIAILEAHRKWLAGEDGGERAYLRDVNLEEAKLRDANLRCADLWWSNLRWADLSGADLRDANLEYTDLHGAYLRDADLRGANLDSSCWSLCCDNVGVNVDIRLVYQLLACVCALECDEAEFLDIKAVILPYAAKSHKAGGFGILERSEIGSEIGSELGQKGKPL